MAIYKKTDIKKYLAFISYRHADNKEQGRQWATWLHQAIETYEVPADLVGKINARGDEIHARIYPVFRDEQELPAHADLGTSITQALDSTRLLIVLCSPNAVASTYVADEIDYFKKKGHSDRIIAAMINGEPNTSWDTSKQKLGFNEQDECFPEPLQFEYDAQGNQATKRAEPIAADFRINNNGQPEQGWTTPEAYRQYLKETTQLNNKQIQEKIEKYQQQQNLMLLKIIAGILGVPLGELTQRDKEYQLEQERLRAQKLKRWLSAVAMLSIVSIGVGIFAFIQREEAVDQRDIALTTQSRFLSGVSLQEQKKGHSDRAMLLMLNAIPGLYGGSRPVQPRPALLQLKYATLNNSKLGIFQDEKVNRASFSPDGQVLLTSSYDNSVVLWSVKTGKRRLSLKQEYKINNAILSPDGQTLLVASYRDTDITLWSVKSGKLLHTLKHKGSDNHASFSPDGQTILTASNDTTAAIWSVKTGKRLHTYEHEGSVKRGIFNPDGQTFVTTFYDYTYSPDDRHPAKPTRTSVLWSVKTGKRLKVYQHGRYNSSTAFSPDGKTLVTNHSDGTVALWSIKTGKRLQIIQNAQGSSYKTTFSPDGQTLVIKWKGKKWGKYPITLWSLKTGKPLQGFQEMIYPVIDHVAFSNDGITLATILEDNLVALRSLKTGKLLQSFKHSGIYNLTFSPDGKMFITTSHDGAAVLWSVDAGKRLQVFQHDDSVTYSAFSPDGHAAITISDDNTVSLWKINAEIRHGKDVINANFSPDGQTMVTASIDNTAAIWSVKTGQRLQTFQHQGYVSNAVYSHDGQSLLTSSWDNTAALWSIKTGKRFLTFQHQDHVWHAAFSPDGQAVVTASDDHTAALWSVETGRQLRIFQHDDGVRRAIFSPDGHVVMTILVGDDDKESVVSLWSVETGKRLQVFQHSDRVHHASFSPDGQIIVTASEDEASAICSVKTGKCLQVMLHKYGGVLYAAFSPNGRTVVTASSNRKATLWSVETGKKLKAISHGDSVRKAIFTLDGQSLITQSGDVAFLLSIKTGKRLQSFKHIGMTSFNVSPDGKSLVTTSEDGTVMIFPILTTDIISYAVNQLPINRTCLTPKEREQFFLSELTDEQWIKRGCEQYTKINRDN